MWLKVGRKYWRNYLMINLFERFDRPSLDFLRSQVIAKIKIPTVAMYDDGFLPENIDSPIQYFCKLGGNKKPLYFDQLPVPDFWRIDANGSKASVFDMNRRRANIFFSATNNSRLVKEVQWLDSYGKVAWVDHYDQHGQRFAKTIYSSGRAVSRKYFDNRGRLVLTWNLIADDLFLHTGLEQRHFASYVDFVCYYLNVRHYNLDHVFINTLNKSLAVVLRLKPDGEDTIFWHEATDKDLPGNMKFVMENKTRVKHIVFQRFEDWQRRVEFLPEDTGNVDFRYLGIIYPHPRSNQLRANALIFTNSDQIEHLDDLVKMLPNVHFNIAAITEMSSKLMAFQDYPNVDLYPVVKPNRVKQLINDCDIYFDINHGNEILDSVRGAFEQNMLILGFKNTLHQPQLVAAENIFDPNNTTGMAQQVLTALVQPRKMKKLIDEQRLVASDMKIEDYKKVLGALINE